MIHVSSENSVSVHIVSEQFPFFRNGLSFSQKLDILFIKIIFIKNEKILVNISFYFFVKKNNLLMKIINK